MQTDWLYFQNPPPILEGKRGRVLQKFLYIMMFYLQGPIFARETEKFWKHFLKARHISMICLYVLGQMLQNLF